jgi:hypothetical protein
LLLVAEEEGRVRVVLVVLVLVVLVRRRFGVGMGELLGRFLEVGRRLARSQKAIVAAVLLLSWDWWW